MFLSQPLKAASWQLAGLFLRQSRRRFGGLVKKMSGDSCVGQIQVIKKNSKKRLGLPMEFAGPS